MHFVSQHHHICLTSLISTPLLSQSVIFPSVCVHFIDVKAEITFYPSFSFHPRTFLYPFSLLLPTQAAGRELEVWWVDSSSRR